MSREHYEKGCPGCQPVILDLTGKVLPPDGPEMRAAKKTFDEMTLPEKEAWHRYMCRNARDPRALLAVQLYNERLTERLKTIGYSP